MKCKDTYSFVYDIKDKKTKNLFNVNEKIDNIIIYVNMSKNQMIIKDCKHKKKYYIKINRGENGEISYSNAVYYKKKRKIKICLEELENILENIPEIVSHTINLFSINTGEFYYKILYPIKIYTTDKKEIQLDIFMIHFNNKVYFIMEPLDFSNNGYKINFNLEKVSIEKYAILTKTKEELEKMDIDFLMKKTEKLKFLYLPYFYLFGENKYQEKLYKYFNKFFPKEIEIPPVHLYNFLNQLYNLNDCKFSFLNNKFTTNEDIIKDIEKCGDYIEYQDQDNIKRIISQNYNVSIYCNEEENTKFFLQNTLEGFLILNLFNSYQEIVSNDEINPFYLKQFKNLIDVEPYIENNSFLYEFHERIKLLKQFQRLEYEFEKKLGYASAKHEMEMLAYQKKNNTLFIILTIISIVVACVSIYASISVSN